MRSFLFWMIFIGFFVFCFLSFKYIDERRESSARDELKELRKENNILYYSFKKLKSNIEDESLFLVEVSKEFPDREIKDITKILKMSDENYKEDPEKSDSSIE